VQIRILLLEREYPTKSSNIIDEGCVDYGESLKRIYINDFTIYVFGVLYYVGVLYYG
jgi:hypothetical protein